LTHRLQCKFLDFYKISVTLKSLMATPAVTSPKPPQIHTYHKADVAWFHSKEDQNWLFSNMAGGMPIFWPLERVPKNHWAASESIYQACKFSTKVMCLPESAPDADPCVRNRIKAQKAPRGAKMTQKCAVKAGLVRADWETVKVPAMLWVLELKLYWNRQTFGSALEDTGKRVIVEVSTKDDFWGCKEIDGALVGQNQLGFLLMDVRSRLKEIIRGKFTDPKGFLLP